MRTRSRREESAHQLKRSGLGEECKECLVGVFKMDYSLSTPTLWGQRFFA